MIPRRYGVLLSPDEIHAAERQLRDLLGAAVVDGVLDVRVREVHVDIIIAVTNLRVLDAVELLGNMTAPGGRLDPRDMNADIPWAALLHRLRDDQGAGTQVAKGWYLRLDHMMQEDHPVNPVVVAVAAYFVAGFELLGGRGYRARRWTWTANNVVEFEEPEGLMLTVYLRASKLWHGIG